MYTIYARKFKKKFTIGGEICLFQYFYRCFIELTNNKMTSALLKSFSQSRLSKPMIPFYIKVFQMNQSESKDEFSSFATLHDLFTRQLKTGARPIVEGEQSVSSPVDGVLEDYGSIQADKTIIVKGKMYSIKEMLSNDAGTPKVHRWEIYRAILKSKSLSSYTFPYFRKSITKMDIRTKIVSC